MQKKMTCPNCKSDDVRPYDHRNPRIDAPLRVYFKCDECYRGFDVDVIVTKRGN